MSGSDASRANAYARLLNDPRLRGAALVLIVALIALRQPEALTEGRFWAEEGILYFRKVLAQGFWVQVFQPENGYYSFFVWIATGLASLAPLRYAPLVTGYLSLAAMLIAPLLLLYAPLRVELAPWRRALAALAALLAPTTAGLWLNSINAQFFFGLAAAILLITDIGRPRFFWVAAGLLLLCGLSSPIAAFAAPLFLLQALRYKDLRIKIAAGLFAAAAALQAACMLVSLLDSPRVQDGGLLERLLAVPVRLGLHPFLLREGAQELFEAILNQGMTVVWPAAALGLASLLFALYLAWRSPPGAALWLWSAMVLITTLSLLGSIYVTDPLRKFSLEGGARYVFAGQVLFAVLLLQPAPDAARAAKALRSVMIALYFAGGVLGYMETEKKGPSWPAVLRAWQENPSYPAELAVWPGRPDLEARHKWILVLSRKDMARMGMATP